MTWNCPEWFLLGTQLDFLCPGMKADILVPGRYFSVWEHVGACGQAVWSLGACLGMQVDLLGPGGPSGYASRNLGPWEQYQAF